MLRQQSIDISCPPGSQQQTRRTLLQRSIAVADRRTDTRPLHRPGSAYYARGVDIDYSLSTRMRIKRYNPFQQRADMLYIYPAYTTENIFTLIADHFGVGPGREIGPLCVSVRMIPF